MGASVEWECLRWEKERESFSGGDRHFSFPQMEKAVVQSSFVEEAVAMTEEV